MNSTITLREFEKLVPKTPGLETQTSTDRKIHNIPQEDFDEIYAFVMSRPEEERALEPGHGFLRARNYVGILQTRRGRIVEILPKIELKPGSLGENETDTEAEKAIFLKMLRTWRNGQHFKNMGSADVRVLKSFPLLEIFITLFLEELLALTHRGLARSYTKVERNLYMLKGRLVLAGQLRHNLVHRERFYVRYEEFSADRPVNRLLKSTVLLLQGLSRTAKNQTLIQQARFYFDEVPKSANISADLDLAKVDRTMPGYLRLLPWVSLFWEGSLPSTYRGSQLAFALLFPMEKIFEDYVSARLRREMWDWKLHSQEHGPYLMKKNHQGKPEFQLRPDIVARKNGQILVMDCKWKRLNENESDKHCGISQSDLYQLYAYGKKYAAEGGSVPPARIMRPGQVGLCLFYPWNRNFTEPRTYLYESDPRLELKVCPVHLDNDEIPVLREIELEEGVKP